MSRLAEILKKKRKELSLSADEIALRIGKSKRTYLYYEEDKEPRHDVLQKLAQILQFDPSELYMDDEKNNTKTSVMETDINKEKQFEQDYKDKYIALLEEHTQEMKDRIKSLLQINYDLKTEVKANLDTVLGNQLVLSCLFDSYVKHFASVIIHGEEEQRVFCSSLHTAAFELVKDVSRMGSHLSIGSEGIVSNGSS